MCCGIGWVFTLLSRIGAAPFQSKKVICRPVGSLWHPADTQQRAIRAGMSWPSRPDAVGLQGPGAAGIEILEVDPSPKDFSLVEEFGRPWRRLV